MWFMQCAVVVVNHDCLEGSEQGQDVEFALWTCRIEEKRKKKKKRKKKRKKRKRKRRRRKKKLSVLFFSSFPSPLSLPTD